jgi:hypothetical protein
MDLSFAARIAARQLRQAATGGSAAVVGLNFGANLL